VSSEGRDLKARWEGTCIHNVLIPRSIQKRRQMDSDDLHSQFDYHDSRRAMAVAVNTKFSLIAVGTQGSVPDISRYVDFDHFNRGSVEVTNFPMAGSASQPQVLQIPNLYGQAATGSVCTMEWSSDGYVLAVGWDHGWAVWSVAGRCLAWGFGTEYGVDEEKRVSDNLFA
jgi:RAB6A-GEF complex partner protein 1